MSKKRKLAPLPDFGALNAAEPVELVDTHTHLNDAAFDGDRAEAIGRARAAGVTRLINLGDSRESSAWAVRLAEENTGFYAGVGIHPSLVQELPGGRFTDETAQGIAALAASPHVVCIGEIGLDYYYEKDEQKKEAQRQAFAAQLDLARQLHLPVCIHAREAAADTMALLKKEGKGLRGVLHCYSGSWEDAQELLRLGWYLGFDGPITFKSARRAPEIVARMPLSRLLIETDTPYMAPEPMRGRRNEPAFARFVAARAAALRGISLSALSAQTTQNAMALYGLS